MSDQDLQIIKIQKSLLEVTARISELSDQIVKLGGEARVQRSSATNQFEKIAAHSVSQRLEANAILAVLQQQTQEVLGIVRRSNDVHERTLHELDLIKLDVEFIRSQRPE